MTGAPRPETWLARMSACRAALADLAGDFPAMLSTADAATGERWTGGQIAAHIAEILPFWLGEADRIVSSDQPRVGRTKKAPERLEAVARALHQPVDALVADMLRAVDDATERVRKLDVADLDRAGEHVVRGGMTAAQLVETFVVDHLEEHVAQAREARA